MMLPSGFNDKPTRTGGADHGRKLFLETLALSPRLAESLSRSYRSGYPSVSCSPLGSLWPLIYQTACLHGRGSGFQDPLSLTFGWMSVVAVLQNSRIVGNLAEPRPPTLKNI